LCRFVGHRRKPYRTEQPNERPPDGGIIIDDVHQTIRGHAISLGPETAKKWQVTGRAAITWIKFGLLSANKGEGFCTLTSIVCPVQRSRELLFERDGQLFHVAAKFDSHHDGTGPFPDAREA
jgi:hypothetical protein